MHAQRHAVLYSPRPLMTSVVLSSSLGSGTYRVEIPLTRFRTSSGKLVGRPKRSSFVLVTPVKSIVPVPVSGSSCPCWLVAFAMVNLSRRLLFGFWPCFYQRIDNSKEWTSLGVFCPPFALQFYSVWLAEKFGLVGVGSPPRFP